MVRQFFPEIPAVVIGNAVFPTEKKACPGSKKKKHLISCVGSLTKISSSISFVKLLQSWQTGIPIGMWSYGDTLDTLGIVCSLG